ncbi:OTU domain-containing protein OS=Streptomyces fumanus OX=67302 GN=GCM10018772_56770 PE=4 SV=1 [Streptomyces fumanus]
MVKFTVRVRRVSGSWWATRTCAPWTGRRPGPNAVEIAAAVTDAALAARAGRAPGLPALLLETVRSTAPAHAEEAAVLPDAGAWQATGGDRDAVTAALTRLGPGSLALLARGDGPTGGEVALAAYPPGRRGAVGRPGR